MDSNVAREETERKIKEAIREVRFGVSRFALFYILLRLGMAGTVTTFRLKGTQAVSTTNLLRK